MDPASLGFMLAMQAAGMIVDYSAKQEQIKQGALGAQVEQAGITSNIAQARLQYEDESLQSMKQLRQNLGSQMALNAARGTRSGAGNAAISQSNSTSNFNADARMRKINELSQEANLKAGMTLSKLHESTNENKITNEFRQSVFNKLPTDPSSYKKASQIFSGGSSSFSGSKSSGSGSYGLTRVG